MIQYRKWTEIPEGIHTKTQLSKMGLKLSAGQAVTATIRRYGRVYKLYAASEATPKAKRSAAQIEAARRNIERAQQSQSCNRCGQYNRRGGLCQSCQFDEMIDKDWRRAIAQIKQLAERDNWVVVDTETTELYQPEIVQIAIVSAGGEILLNSLVKPKTPISAAASEVHGLTMELLHNAPTWGEVGARVDELIGDRLVVAYNAEFDNKALATTNKLHNREGVGGDWLCMMELVAMVAGDYSRYHKGYTWLSLSEACSIWDVEMTRAHDAAGDALAVVDLVRQVAGQ